MNVVITGSAGYIGGLLLKKFSSDVGVKKIICIDLAEQPESTKGDKRIIWIRADLAEHTWEEKVLSLGSIDVFIHCAFKIRNPYGKIKETEELNLRACRNVFKFCFRNNISKLIYLSSVAAYGAKPENIGRLLTENDQLAERKNPYGLQKAESERLLRSLFETERPKTQVFVLRLNSVTGPLGQSLSSKFGLITFLRKILPFIIETGPHWARQFVHEEDVVQIIQLLATGNRKMDENPAIFNVAPKTFLTAKDMGKILHKPVAKIPAWAVRPAFSIAWHMSLGKIPTLPESAGGLIYPINVDGSKIEKIGFRYAHTPKEAFFPKQ